MRPVTRRLARTLQHGITRLFPLALGLLGAGNAFAQAPQLTALCSTDQTWCELAAKEFQAATGIKVLQVRKATGEALAQLRAEAANPKTDLWWGGTGDPYLQAAEAGLLEAYRPAYLNDLHGWAVRQYAMSGNMVGGFYTSAIGFGWNEDVLKKRKLAAPRCWSDLLNPAYKGEIETSHPASSGTGYTILAGLVQMMGEEPAFDYLKKLHRNVTQYTRSGTAQAKSVAKGEVGIGVSFIFGFDKWRHDKYPVKTVAPCEGTGYEVGGIAIVKGARNKEAAQRFIEFCLRPEQQKAWALAGFYMPNHAETLNTLRASPEGSFLPDLENGKNAIIDPAWWGDNLTEVQRRYSEWMIS